MSWSPCLEREVWNRSFGVWRVRSDSLRKQPGTNAEWSLPLTNTAPLSPRTLLSGCEGHQTPCCDEKTLESCRQAGRDRSNGLEITFMPSSRSGQTSVSNLVASQNARFCSFFPLRGVRPPPSHLFLCGPGPSCATPCTLLILRGVVQLGLHVWSPEGSRAQITLRLFFGGGGLLPGSVREVCLLQLCSSHLPFSRLYFGGLPVAFRLKTPFTPKNISFKQQKYLFGLHF